MESSSDNQPTPEDVQVGGGSVNSNVSQSSEQGAPVDTGTQVSTTEPQNDTGSVAAGASFGASETPQVADGSSQSGAIEPSTQPTATIDSSKENTKKMIMIGGIVVAVVAMILMIVFFVLK